MIKRLERLKMPLINTWPTYDLSVRTEVGRKSTTKCIGNIYSKRKRHVVSKAFSVSNNTLSKSKLCYDR
jgi:hypothetical protein